MPNKEWEKHCELVDRSCDALVLAYSPNQILGRDFGKNFYIPSCHNVEEAFGYSLRKTFGRKEAECHWADAVKLSMVANLDKLEKRILNGVKEVFSGHPEEQNYFGMYFSGLSGRFEQTWIFLKGDLYKFREGKREEAIQKFQMFWNEEERNRWKQLHEFMRKYTLKEFKKKSE
jgi:hypothetical protein